MFKPTFAFVTITDVNIEFLQKHNIKGLILDLDNTLTTHDNPIPAEKVTEWIENMKKNCIKMMIVSNNYSERVAPFAKLLKLDFVARGRKPLTTGFNKARNIMELDYKNIAIVGDQIFTDIVGANVIGVKTIYVKPIQLEKTAFFKFKRKLEKFFLKKIEYEKLD